MEIFTLLETLEDLLERGRNVPFSAKIIVDKEEMLDLIKEIRLKLPDELKQAKWVKEERQRILAESQKETYNTPMQTKTTAPTPSGRGISEEIHHGIRNHHRHRYPSRHASL